LEEREGGLPAAQYLCVRSANPTGALDTIAEGQRLSTYRRTQPGETFLRYESGNPAFTRVTAEGGLTPGTFVCVR